MTISSPSPDPLLRAPTSSIGAGRLGVYAALGAIAGTVPLPWIPDSLARRLRGALVHDVAARHGLSLTADAREALADPDGFEAASGGGFLRQAARFALVRVLRRIGPMSAVPPVRRALSVFVLGYLFDRYLELARRERAVRIDGDEARRVRSAIDRALLHAITAEADETRVAAAPEELRDTTTQLIDTMIIAAASLPEWLTRRLDAAFDELMPQQRG